MKDGPARAEPPDIFCRGPLRPLSGTISFISGVCGLYRRSQAAKRPTSCYIL
jgi:hypothetical protein